MGATCSVDECERAAQTRGLCVAHYQRLRKFGDVQADKPLRLKGRTPVESFAARTVERGECLIWVGATLSNGYGAMWDGSRTVLAHRWSFEFYNGKIPEDMQVDHTCWNPACVKPEHLRLATPKQNRSNMSYAKSGSATGHRNVYRQGGKYVVQIQKAGERHNLGTFLTVEEASAVAEDMRLKLFGEYAGRGKAA